MPAFASSVSQAPPAVATGSPDGVRKRGYQPQLDGLRGIAVLSVVLHHFDVRLPGMFDWGPIGVRIFFLLSGYLITLSLWRLHADVKEAGGGYWMGLLGFHGRRLARLLPVLYVMLGVAFVMGLPEFRRAMLWHAVFGTNLYALHVGQWPDAASHLWSLSVQEQFYLLWPFLILITPRKWLPGVLVTLFVAGFAFRAAIIESGASDFYRWVMLPGVIDSFALGSLIACVKKAGRPLPFTTPGWRSVAVGLVALSCYVLARFIRFGPFPGPVAALIETLENLFFAWLLIRTVAGWRGVVGAVFESRLLVHLGRVSYGLYIFHVLVNVALSPWLARHGLTVADHAFLRCAVLLTVSIGIASISYHYLEAPLAAWVRRRESSLRGVRA
jgi:peptidoglycan/LPS O-acetylase OafA/YrhL